MPDFDDKTALVTGGGTGIGRATALAFAREGARVVIGNRNAERGEETVGFIREAGGEAAFLHTDVTKAADVEALVDFAVETYGGLDVAFNNAGIDGEINLLTDQSEENYHQVMDINVKGVWLSMKYEIRQMLKGGGGAIVNNSSIAGLIGFPGVGLYVASKHAVVGLTKTAALEYGAQGIRVNAVNPAAIQTDMIDRILEGTETPREDLVQMHPIGRIGRPEEVAEAVLFLASERSSFVLGHSLYVDGGFLAQ